jgi:hypothetical protein
MCRSPGNDARHRLRFVHSTLELLCAVLKNALSGTQSLAPRPAAESHGVRAGDDTPAAVERLIERYNEAWNRHDVDAIVSMHAPDMVFENHTAGD